MKKMIFMIAFALLALGLAGAAFAASAQVFVHVTVVTGNVGITRDGAADIYFNQVLVSSSTTTANSTSFHNSGDTLENWALSATNTATWTFLSTAPGAATGVNNVRLAALWHANVAPLASDYAADDTITGSVVTSSATNYAVTADPAAVKGYMVAPNTVPDHYIYFRLDTPAAGSTGLSVNQDFTVTVTSSSAI